ncbi:MAG: hypothetical protein JWP87_3959 [Labilithrix sp.]|nr:hypothetical protein [Labilithrix sp.]
MRSSLLPSVALGALGALLATASGCRNVSRFSSKTGDHFEGDVVQGNFVRTGVADGARMCVTLDANRLQDAPGTLTTSDGRFKGTLLRPIPQIWHDPLSTLSFGEGRVQNLVYVATPVAPAGDTQDVMVFMSLMEEGGIEVRLVRGAPQVDAGTPAPGPVQAAPMFGIFTLDRRDGPCAF